MVGNSLPLLVSYLESRIAELELDLERIPKRCDLCAMCRFRSAYGGYWSPYDSYAEI